jgi:hypothetical protein
MLIIQGQAPAIYCEQHRRHKQVQIPIQIQTENGSLFDLIDEPSFSSLKMRAYIDKEKASTSKDMSFAERKVAAHRLLIKCACHVEDCPSKDYLVNPKPLKINGRTCFKPQASQKSCFDCGSILSPLWWPENDHHLCHKCAFSRETRKLDLFLL